MENLQKVMKTLANEIVDVEGKLDEVSSKPFKPFKKKIHRFHLVAKL
jgi:hypothetical protein